MDWINIKDKLPEDPNEEHLCISTKFGDIGKGSSCFVILNYEDGVWLDDNGRDYENNPDYHWITYWLEIPEIPTG